MKETTRVRRYFESTRWKPSEGRAFLVEERQRLLKQAALRAATPLSQVAICDVGCGFGDDLAAWTEAGVPEGQLAGTELLPERVEVARARVPRADIRLVDDYDLPFDDASFDVCTASLVLSTASSPAARRRLLGEMSRVTKANGVVVIYDFVVKKPWNRRVRRVSTRELALIWRKPTATLSAAPFLPALDVALHTPAPIRDRIAAVLPKTHRVWVWTNGDGRRSTRDSEAAETP